MDNWGILSMNVPSAIDIETGIPGENGPRKSRTGNLWQLDMKLEGESEAL
jgi:hypothetical protein